MKPMILLDNGHGCDTRGKSSPDGRYREWQGARRLTAEILRRLTDAGIQTSLIVPEDTDVPLAERIRRANTIASGQPCILVSIHSNAAGDGTAWHSASGFSAFVAPGASPASRQLAAALTRSAIAAGLQGNRRTPPCGYWEASLAICRRTICPAVLTENMFHDNRADVDFLLSDHGTAILADVHASTIISLQSGGNPLKML